MTTDPSRWLIVVTGPTAVGKTSVSIEIAKHFSTEIISADSRQFFKEISIGTARPSVEELRTVHHHFIGHLSIADRYNVSGFEMDALKLLELLFQHHRVIVMTGGSGLYINAVCHGIDELPDPDPALRELLRELLKTQGIIPLQEKLCELDPVYYKQVDQDNPIRLIRAIEVSVMTGLPYSSFRKNKPKPRSFKTVKIGLTRDRPELFERINSRVDQMMMNGLLEEARNVYPFRHVNALNTVGYKELFAFFDGLMTLEEAIEKIRTNTRRFARRQLTWFDKDKDIRWFHPDEYQKIINYINSAINVTNNIIP